MIGQHPNSVASRFKPGNAAWNKGVKGWGPPGSKATQFQPGNLPRNWVPVGSYRVGTDGDLQIKWRDCPGANHLRWKPVARLVWGGRDAKDFYDVHRGDLVAGAEIRVVADKLQAISSTGRHASAEIHGQVVSLYLPVKGDGQKQAKTSAAPVQ